MLDRQAQVVQGFVALAESLIALIDGHQSYELRPFVEKISQTLAALYAAALELPEEEEDKGEEEDTEEELDIETDLTPEERASEDASHEKWQELYGRLNHYFGEENAFTIYVDPYEAQDEPVTSELGDCLADIYVDLQEGLDLYREGNLEEAIWEWRFNFLIHWGIHLTEALYAMHWLMRRWDQENALNA